MEAARQHQTISFPPISSFIITLTDERPNLFSFLLLISSSFLSLFLSFLARIDSVAISLDSILHSFRRRRCYSNIFSQHQLVE
jgi:hypothetical protein